MTSSLNIGVKVDLCFRTNHRPLIILGFSIAYRIVNFYLEWSGSLIRKVEVCYYNQPPVITNSIRSSFCIRIWGPTFLSFIVGR